MSDNLELDPKYRQGEWVHMTCNLPNEHEVTDAFNRFWGKCEVDHFVYDKNGKLIDVVRTDKLRERPIKKEHWVRGVSKKKT